MYFTRRHARTAAERAQPREGDSRWRQRTQNQRSWNEPVTATRTRSAPSAQRYQEASFHLACVLVLDAHAAEDVVQDALMQAYLAMPGFRADAPFSPWHLHIVANEARNRRRSAGRRAHLLGDAAAEQRITPNASAPASESVVLADEQRTVLLAAVAGLRDQDRVAIAGRYFLDLSETDIADLLGCARGTVKSRVSRGLARPRERLVSRAAIAVLVGAVLLGLGLLAWPDARNAIAESLGLCGTGIAHLDAPPQSSEIGVDLGLGAPVTSDQAARVFGAPVLQPAERGAPDTLYATGGQVGWSMAPAPAPISPRSRSALNVASGSKARTPLSARSQ